MAEDICFFKRVEKKYIIDENKRAELLSLIGNRLTEDSHGRSTVSSLYLDTPDYRLIRNSIEAKSGGSAYKEKLRLRSYGTPRYDSRIFFEIKKKYKGTVYKRRVSMMLSQALAYIYAGEKPPDSQVMREIDYTMRFYGQPRPSMLLCYERDAYYIKNMPAHRITFDTSVRYRADNFTPEGGDYGKTVIPGNTVIMEIKTDGAMPLWLVAALEKCKIYPASFSKYGTAYADYVFKN